ncbi:translation initiation factor IF-2 subunit beta [Candidatus Marsarchaeota archaeon]|nr:translation initiation factor IF-2 subunit beta [Candidatus Marsarchaeota archaeon]MCL5099614.1 translation initiation factor IF-2 subunit beta [Candidatus Marsarchaeota archaeon]
MGDEEYNALLDRAFSKLPSLAAEHSDFVIPTVDSIVQGAKTIIRNISAIADKARRNVGDISRYLSKELSVPVNMEEQRLVLNGRFSTDDLNARMKRYFEVYVICRECHKPDTHLEGASRGMFYLVCEACGARYGVKNY